YLVVNDDGTFKLQPGTGYVEGIRIDQAAEQIIVPALPAEIFLDVALQPQDNDRVAVASVVFANPGDYTDETNDNHYGQKIAAIDAGGVVTDFRPKSLAGEMGDIVADKNHVHPQYADKDHTHATPDRIDTDYIAGAAMTPSTTGGASVETIETAVNKQDFAVMTFAGGADSAAEFSYPMPEAWNRGAIKAKLLWLPEDGATIGEDVVFALQTVALSEGDALDVAFAGTGVSIADQALGDGVKHLSPASAALTVEGNPALADLIHFRLTRDVSAGASPMAEGCRVLGIWIQYTCNKPVVAW
ncbi:MAG: hypothetical protein JEZ11_28475, partial [Desulfobacterales bacterium]|nr:hypothetical protein [Desulfobacterales bacterium]